MIISDLRQIFSVNNISPLMNSHTSCPVPMLVDSETVSLLFSSRDSQQRARVFQLNYNLMTHRVNDVVKTPVLDVGPPSFFDDDGVYPSCVVTEGDTMWLYYMGRSNRVAPFYNMAIGIAQHDQQSGEFKKVFSGPVLGQNINDPWMVSTPWVTRAGSEWIMIYLSGLGWSENFETSTYRLKIATSPNGLDWTTSERFIQAFESVENVAKPCLIETDTGWYMLFSYIAEQGGQYQLGYLHSESPHNWDECEIHPIMVEGEGDEREVAMYAYPTVFQCENRLHIVMSSADLGKTAMYCATLTRSE
ncbi:hypothetical protein [Bowmanella denitrificans]|uniref:hypothetical protein n=1 Tax=Bowmanella denitrificans TaxID=366582 RepID=UPI000C99CDB4|nr:hypothetical protein [Bowmanella denitrificans]